MVISNIRFAFRQLNKNKVFTIVNVVGLALSMVACLLIFKYVSFEKSYDAYHEEAEDIYRIYRIADGEDPDDGVASIFPGITPLLKREIPEFEYVTRVIGSDKMFQSFAFTHFSSEGKANTFNMPKAFFADHDALDIFKLNWLEGQNSRSLQNPNELVISQSFAKRFFGDAEAVGQVLRFKNMEVDYLVTGVFENVPENSHFKFNVLCSFSSLPEEWELDTSFGWGNFYTYAKLVDNSDLVSLEPKMNDLISQHGETWYKEEGIYFKFQNIPDIHLTSHHSYELEANGNKSTVLFLSIIGVFIMVIAWVNYINLSTSKLVERAKEVGIRKVMGGYRRQLIGQFLSESLLVNLFALVLALTALQLSRNFFESLIGIEVNYFSGNDLNVTLGFAVLFCLGSLLFGLYPAVLFSGQKISSVLKGKSKVSKSGLQLRRGLTVFQYVIAVVLILGTVVVKSQLEFIQKESLGMNIDRTLIVKKPFVEQENRSSSKSTFINKVRQMSDISAISASSEIPGYEISRMRWVALGPDADDKSLYAKDLAIDDSFVDLYQIEVLYGRNFSTDFADSTSVILSLSAAEHLLGSEDLEKWINQTIYYETAPYRLVGIVDDISQESLKANAKPHIYTYRDRDKFYSIKVDASDVGATIERVQSAFNMSFASSHFDYFFLDAYFDRQYKADRLFGQIFSFFSLLAIVITSLGLFGLSLYNIGQRSREVSIRKVLGASVNSIFYLLTKEYILLMLLASIIAMPIGYYFVDQWLNAFASRTTLSWTLFLLPVLIVSVLTLLTVLYQVIKTVFANPADSLRYE
ncbi:ABC transporter permease [Roseivirga sp. E12]|uniref:ABC transporter permease n=1 Tax=Roseivirga sp. E12 TaxID=2819237 RepID=UPI001ABCC039|nr:ABC transporter permease [Roseivirga sp. E12]MBO3697150.1 ABC transporter permease [Roseivirga sp. E12]